MSRQDALLLDDSLRDDDVSRAWLVWSGPAETALADAYQFAGGLVPAKGLVLGRGSALVRKARSNAADAHDAADVLMCRDSSVAPLLDMRRRFKAVMDVLDSMIRNGVSLALSCELTVQWGRILAAGPLHPVTLEDFRAAPGAGLGHFHHVVSGVHHSLGDFIHGVVVHRRNWLREDPLVHSHKWLRPDLVLPAPYLQREPHLTPGGSGVLADLARIDEEFRKVCLPYFCPSDQRDAILEEFDQGG